MIYIKLKNEMWTARENMYKIFLCILWLVIALQIYGRGEHWRGVSMEKIFCITVIAISMVAS